ncbi:DMT family transporter [Amycolatopsis sp. K13G38]|uniref:DMT family transporter n=1 Tax=Amycolatopsis acididurans TaxID=2724524 RepID=A0ABX1JEI3_9PSEU|nr:EamA family transporter [Amycolatopsis acididurans]NKQ56911.1 DMT family transporter [Amycolatopsis acididurans]
MGELMALFAAVCFGVTHFVNGLAARRAPALTVSLFAQVGGTVVTVLAALVWTSAAASPAELCWGALSGAGTGVGVAFLYRAMSRGALSVVVPISDVGAVAIPVLVGFALLGERPGVMSAVGVALALPAIWLTSAEPAPPGQHRTTPAPALRDALIAGVGFAVQFLGMTRVPLAAGLWPVAASRVVSVVVIIALIAGSRPGLRVPGGWAITTAGAGALGSVAIVLYWVASHQQLVAIATVLSALYPAIPVVLALVVLRERIGRRQVAGLCGAAGAIALLALA